MQTWCSEVWVNITHSKLGATDHVQLGQRVLYLEEVVEEVQRANACV